ncbi:MAG: MBL fold metallo-hydrolase [Janthinobacterium lividum]
MIVTILGSGTSSGVPRIGNDWGSCDPLDPRNRRRRVSILVEHEGCSVLVDTGPDFRQQMLDAGVRRLDAVLYTHDHADHTHGIDDLRQVFHLMQRPVDCYASPETWAILVPRFSYVFHGTSFYAATARAHDFPPTLRVGALEISCFRQNHGNIDSLGFRFACNGKVMAYSTDIKALPDDAEKSLDDLDLWIVDALRRQPHPTHSHLDQTLGWIERFAPRRAILTHMDQTMDYRSLRDVLPVNVEPGYDGQVLKL